MTRDVEVFGAPEGVVPPQGLIDKVLEGADCPGCVTLVAVTWQWEGRWFASIVHTVECASAPRPLVAVNDLAPVVVADLVPGDVVHIAGGAQKACFLLSTVHPIEPSRRLVLWRLVGGRLSLDTLCSSHYVGTYSPAERVNARTRLRTALEFGGRGWELTA